MNLTATDFTLDEDHFIHLYYSIKVVWTYFKIYPSTYHDSAFFERTYKGI